MSGFNLGKGSSLVRLGALICATTIPTQAALANEWGQISDRHMSKSQYVSAGFASVDFEDSSGSAPGWENDSQGTAWAHGGRRYGQFFSLQGGFDMLGETEGGRLEFGGAQLSGRIHLPLSLFDLPVQGTNLYGSGGLSFARVQNDLLNRSATELGSFFELGAEIAVYGPFYADLGYRRYNVDFDLQSGETAEMEFDIAFFGGGLRF